MGLILLRLQKKQMNGVRVNMTTSLDVNTVKSDVKKYKTINKINWFPFAYLLATLAKWRNKPSSSRMIDIVVIEKKRTSIFKGLIALLLINWFPTSLIGAKENAKRMMAPIRAIIQYVSNLIFPILICGKNGIDKITDINVIEAIIIVGIITKSKLCSFCLFKTIIMF